MICDVMPTISEDGSTDRESQESGDDANYEQLMVNMLDERDKLMEALREGQEQQITFQSRIEELQKEKDSLQRQLLTTQPQVNHTAVAKMRSRVVWLPWDLNPQPICRSANYGQFSVRTFLS